MRDPCVATLKLTQVIHPWPSSVWVKWPFNRDACRNAFNSFWIPASPELVRAAPDLPDGPCFRLAVWNPGCQGYFVFHFDATGKWKLYPGRPQAIMRQPIWPIAFLNNSNKKQATGGDFVGCHNVLVFSFS
jgi:hypothetical protein